MKPRSPLSLLALALLGLTACGDDGKKTTQACDADADCSGGVCFESVCYTACTDQEACAADQLCVTEARADEVLGLCVVAADYAPCTSPDDCRDLRPGACELATCLEGGTCGYEAQPAGEPCSTAEGAGACDASGACVPSSVEPCGDGVCDREAGEGCQNCPDDCDACPVPCGDGTCDAEGGEDCATCTQDCACADGQECSEQGVCVPTGCVPDCGQRICGDDGCGGSCGVCPNACTGEDDPQLCVEGACQQACCPDCTGRVCGDDGCGGSCGECGATAECVEGECVAGTPCGDGSCQAGEDCVTCPEDCTQCAGGYLWIFDDQVTTGFSTSITADPWQASLAIEAVEGGPTFLGPFGKQTVTLSSMGGTETALAPLATFPFSLPAHDLVRVSFDLLILGSWDGHSAGDHSTWPSQPDRFTVAVQGTNVTKTFTFANCADTLQSYPDVYDPQADVVAEFGPKNGAASTEPILTLDGCGDAVYRVTFQAAHAAPFFVMEFRGEMNDYASARTLENESWGLDNVQVELLKVGGGSL